MKSDSQTSNGMQFPGWLTILLIGLKLTGHINWPWLWVLSPLWLSFCLWVFMIFVIAFGLAITNKK